MRNKKAPWITAAFLVLGACSASPPGADAGKHTKIIGFAQDAPAHAPPGTCWGKTFTPAVIETVKQKVLVRKARLHKDGSVKTPAKYKTKTLHQIVQPRRENWFETVCPRQMSGEFIASLQRALSVRGKYQGEITGLMDEPTRRAIQAYQKGSGFDSGNLTLASAYALGLIAIPRT